MTTPINIPTFYDKKYSKLRINITQEHTQAKKCNNKLTNNDYYAKVVYGYSDNLLNLDVLQKLKYKLSKQEALSFNCSKLSLPSYDSEMIFPFEMDE